VKLKSVVRRRARHSCKLSSIETVSEELRSRMLDWPDAVFGAQAGTVDGQGSARKNEATGLQ